MTRELRAAAITNHSVIPAVVTQNADEDQLGRVKVRFPWMSSQDESDWLPVAAPGAGAQRGLFFVPEINDLVLVAFAFGRIDRAYVIGSLWNTQDKRPAQERAQRTLKSVSGHVITLDDTAGAELITIVERPARTRSSWTPRTTRSPSSRAAI